MARRRPKKTVKAAESVPEPNEPQIQTQEPNFMDIEIKGITTFQILFEFLFTKSSISQNVGECELNLNYLCSNGATNRCD